MRHIRLRTLRGLRWASWAAMAAALICGLLGWVLGFGFSPHGGTDAFTIEGAFLMMLYGSVVLVPVFAIPVWILGFSIPVTPEEQEQFSTVPLSKSRIALEEGLAAASIHLLDPTYIAEYAKATGTNLEGVHKLLRTGQLSAYRHKGVLFVGRKKAESPELES